MNEQALAILRISLTSGIGAATYKKLLAAFGSPLGILGAPQSRLTEIQGIGERTASAIITARNKSAELADREMKLAEQYNAKICTIECDDYPRALTANVGNAPLVLYIKGDILKRDAMALGVVGTRTATRYGLTQSKEMSAQMATRGYTIISGLARGIDTAAHKGALEAGGRTIAVLGTGLAKVYPAENLELAKEIVTSGAVISEFPMNTAPARENFPRRNRVISGLSLGVLVVEGKERSGAMITASCAAEQGRTVFAIPGPINSPLSAGPNALIKDSATIVTEPNDISRELGPSAEALKLREVAINGEEPEKETEIKIKPAGFADPATYAGLTSKAKKVLQCVPADPIHVDDITAMTDMSPEDISSVLLTLELQTLVKQLPGKRYLRLA